MNQPDFCDNKQQINKKGSNLEEISENVYYISVFKSRKHSQQILKKIPKNSEKIPKILKVSNSLHPT
jgi:hypothetical protein